MVLFCRQGKSTVKLDISPYGRKKCLGGKTGPFKIDGIDMSRSICCYEGKKNSGGGDAALRGRTGGLTARLFRRASEIRWRGAPPSADGRQLLLKEGTKKNILRVKRKETPKREDAATRRKKDQAPSRLPKHPLPLGERKHFSVSLLNKGNRDLAFAKKATRKPRRFGSMRRSTRKGNPGLCGKEGTRRNAGRKVFLRGKAGQDS